MSRIGKKPIQIPDTVSIEYNLGKLSVKGKYGILEKAFSEIINISIESNQIILSRKIDTKISRSYHGLTRALIQNMVLGVSQKFTKTLIAEGVGYKFQIDQKNVNLSMGYSHPVSILIPDDIQVKLESPTKLLISGIDKEKVGLLASEIRSVRPPEPYKGKGIMYEGEKIIRKAGKTGK
jgi:large subunit ribosomal protein L6